jgi:hypothetical protein
MVARWSYAFLPRASAQLDLGDAARTEDADCKPPASRQDERGQIRSSLPRLTVSWSISSTIGSSQRAGRPSATPQVTGGSDLEIDDETGRAAARGTADW